MDKGVAERLLEVREASGTKQTEMAKRLGVSEQTVRRAETGTHKPGVDYIYAVAKEFGVDAAWIIMGTESPAHEKLEEIRRILDRPTKPSVEVPGSLAPLRQSGRLPSGKEEGSGAGNKSASGGGRK